MRLMDKPRLSNKAVPAFWWHWWYGQDEALYNEKQRELASKGFRLVYSQTFTMPDGNARCQSVWAKGGE